MRTVSGVLAGLGGLLLMVAPVVAGPVSQEIVKPSRPDGAKAPSVVEIRVLVLDIDRIDDRTQSFEADIGIAASWSDSRLVHDGPGPKTYALDQVWHPHLSIFNGRGVRTGLPEVVRVAPDGTVRYRQRLYGTFVAAFDLRLFPFDGQRLPISVFSTEYSPNDVTFELDTAALAEEVTAAGWTVRAGQSVVTPLEFTSQAGADFSVQFARFSFEIEAQRSREYYVWKVILPLTVIVCMSWAVFYIDPENISPQIAISSTSILTLIAFLLSLGTLLPQISYLTRLDVFIYGCLLLVFIAFIEGITTSNLAKNPARRNLAHAMDRISRGVFPLAFIGLHLNFWI